MTRAEARRALECAALRYAEMTRGVGDEAWPKLLGELSVLEARANVFLACKALYEATPAEERHG